MRPLVAEQRLSRQVLTEACMQLRMKKTEVYELLRRYRAAPCTTSLVPSTGGTPNGADRLAPEIAIIIERCIERFYLSHRSCLAPRCLRPSNTNAIKQGCGRPASTPCAGAWRRNLQFRLSAPARAPRPVRTRMGLSCVVTPGRGR